MDTKDESQPAGAIESALAAEAKVIHDAATKGADMPKDTTPDDNLPKAQSEQTLT